LLYSVRALRVRSARFETRISRGRRPSAACEAIDSKRSADRDQGGPADVDESEAARDPVPGSLPGRRLRRRQRDDEGDPAAAGRTGAGGPSHPGGTPHGPFDPATPHHAGDMGNLVADASGNATLSTSTDQFSLGTDAKSILGRGLIIHEKADDMKTQPTGN